MRDFERKLITEWRRLQLPMTDATVIIAVSGGADSISLLLATDELRKLGKLDLRLVASHFNHGLRGAESDEDEEFVRQICSERNIEFALGRAGSKHISDVEQSARNDRYDFLRSTAENLRASFVCTAHTRNDQAETFLLNLIRGSGVDGLAGMAAARSLNGSDTSIHLVRPLLNWAFRGDTEQYCHELDQTYRSDTMNEDGSFTRVRIRQILLPLLKDFNPKIIDRLADTAGLLRDEIGPKTDEFQETLSISDLSDLSEPEVRRAVRSWLAGHRGTLKQLGLKHIDAVRRLVNSRKSGKTVELPGGDRVVKEGGKLAFIKNNVEKRPAGA